MTREELLDACFGLEALGLTYTAGQRVIEMTEGPDVLSHLDLSYRRIVVSLPGEVGQETIMVAAISNVCTDPAYRGKGYARALVRRAHAEASEHPRIRYACLFSDYLDFYAPLGYRQVAPEKHPSFLVAQIAGEPWPPGRFDTRGEW